MIGCKTIVISALVLAFVSMWPNTAAGQCEAAAQPRPKTATLTRSPAPPKLRIEKLIFQGQTGLTPIEQADLAESVKDKAGNDESKWVEEFENRLLDAWRERGYFKAQITAKAREISSTPEEKAFVVMAQVESGRRYYLGEIRFLHGTQFSSSEMRSLFPLQTDDLFNTSRIRDGLAALRKAYGAKGFVDFTFVPDTVDDEAHGRIAVEIDLFEGKQFHISEIKVLGLDPVSAKALLQNSGLEPGNILNPESIERFQAAHPAGEILRCIDDRNAAVTLYVDFREPQPEDQ
jgi:outer membrane protein assembly factor BamA